MVLIEGNPWFVAADVCRALGAYVTKDGRVNVYVACQPLAEDEKRVVPRSNTNRIGISFPNRGAFCISESGLYKLVMRSDKPEARSFQDWVTRVVLPAIRKDGMYAAGDSWANGCAERWA